MDVGLMVMTTRTTMRVDISVSGHADAAIINIVSSTSLCDNADADVDDASCYW